MKCVEQRSKDLLETSLTKRQYDLLLKIRDIKGEMNAHGVLNSSTVGWGEVRTPTNSGT